MELLAELRREGRQLLLILDHDKGRSIYTWRAGAWIPYDYPSAGAMRDLAADIPPEIRNNG
jgi:hypothetical protein